MVAVLNIFKFTDSSEDSDVHILDKGDRWFDGGVKEAICVKCEQPTLKRGGGLRFHLSTLLS